MPDIVLGPRSKGDIRCNVDTESEKTFEGINVGTLHPKRGLVFCAPEPEEQEVSSVQLEKVANTETQLVIKEEEVE